MLNTVFKLYLPDDAGVVLILCRADLLCLCRDKCGCAVLLDWLSIILQLNPCRSSILVSQHHSEHTSSYTRITWIQRMHGHIQVEIIKLPKDGVAGIDE